MQNLNVEIRETLRRYFPETNEEHLLYVTDQMTYAVRSYTAMRIAQHQCGCEWNDGTEFCRGFNCAIRLASGMLQGGLTVETQ